MLLRRTSTRGPYLLRTDSHWRENLRIRNIEGVRRFAIQVVSGDDNKILLMRKIDEGFPDAGLVDFDMNSVPVGEPVPRFLNGVVEQQ
jgi:hypothetical protein